MDLAILSVVLALDADVFLSHHAAAMCNASTLRTRWWADHDTDLRGDFTQHRFLSQIRDVVKIMLRHMKDQVTIQRIHCPLE